MAGNHKTKSAVLFKLLTQTIDTLKFTQEINRTVRMTNTQKEKAEKEDSE